MWDFLQYISKERAFNFSRGTLETMRARVGAEVGAQASRTALRILCKSSSKYLETLVAAIGASVMGGFVSKGPAGWLDNLSPDLGGRKESKEAMERAMERAIEGQSRRRRPQPWTEVILELISSKITFPNGLDNLLDMEKLEL